MKNLTVLLMLLGIIPSGECFLTPLQQRDSILIADQFEYGVELDSLPVGADIALPDFSKMFGDTLVLVRNWKVDTAAIHGRRTRKEDRRLFDVRVAVTIAPFEEGVYQLPDIPVQRKIGSSCDTLLFSHLEMDVKTMPVDTSSFEINDIKGQIRYPLTFRELGPYLAAVSVLAALAAALVWWLRRKAAKREELLHKDPPHIVALRELDKYRGDKYWAPDRQKAFYSGITDALKVYIEARFGVDCLEMTTAELFAALKSDKDITPELFDSLKELFERADFVKFAKMTATEGENASALPIAVRFVTDTYQAEIEE